ncbi:MAG: hypothetical protein IJ914_02840 [Prevotella sp.]|nr:hypothetical protein [Prevotella sp.]
MKKTLLKITLLLIAAITASSVNAATETYDFEAAAKALEDANEHYPTYDGTRIFNVENPGWVNIEKMTLTQIDVNGRFAAEARSSSGFNLLKGGNNGNGLNSGYAAERYFSILDLKAGDKVTITYNQGALNNYTRDGSATITGLADAAAIVSGTEYTIAADGRFDMKTGTAKVNIQKIVIASSVPVTINVIPNATTETYDFQALGQAQASDGMTEVTYGTEVLTSPASIKLISFSEKTFNDRFAGNRDWAIRKHSNAAYCGLCTKDGYSGRYLAILGLKAGDKVSIKFICDSEQSLIFNNAIVNGVSANDAVVSDQVYTVKEDGDLILNEGSNTKDKRVYIYKVTIEPADVTTGTYIGATLVSDKALDFTDVNDITAYVATKASAGSVTFSPVTKVAENTPLYIKANEESGSVINVNVPEATEGAVDYSATNLLKGSATSQTSLQSTTNKTYYVFGVKGNEAGFYPVSSSSSFNSAAGKAYLELTDGQAAGARAIEMNFVFDAAPTGIATVRQTMAENVYYNISGQRVANPTKGLYIVNGKKVIK